MITEKAILSEGDVFKKRTVTRISEHFCFFDNKRMSWNKIQQLIDSGEKIIYAKSPNIDIDWSLKKDVLDYYSSFNKWATYISNGCLSKYKIKSDIIEIKDGLVYYEGEYYLPSPKSSFNNSNGKSDVKDGLYNVDLFKKPNCWYSTMKNSETITLNLFTQKQEAVKNIYDLKPNTNELYLRPVSSDHYLKFDYTHDEYNGVKIEGIYNFDVVNFFKSIYVKHAWSNNSKMLNITDLEINEIFYPIENEIRNLISIALNQEKYYADYDINYGDISFYSLKLDNSVSEDIFEIVNKRLKEYKK